VSPAGSVVVSQLSNRSPLSEVERSRRLKDRAKAAIFYEHKYANINVSGHNRFHLTLECHLLSWTHLIAKLLHEVPHPAHGRCANYS
jgi:hypothetical protein